MLKKTQALILIFSGLFFIPQSFASPFLKQISEEIQLEKEKTFASDFLRMQEGGYAYSKASLYGNGVIEITCRAAARAPFEEVKASAEVFALNASQEVLWTSGSIKIPTACAEYSPVCPSKVFATFNLKLPEEVLQKVIQLKIILHPRIEN